MPMRLAIFALLALAVLARGAQAESEQVARYTVRFEGLDQAVDLSDLIRQSSALASKTDDPPPSRAGLQRRADDDAERFETAARSLGYYDATFKIQIGPGAAPGDSFAVVVAAVPGARYTIGSVEIRAADEA